MYYVSFLESYAEIRPLFVTPICFNKQFQIIKMASGISDRYKFRPNLGPYSGAMVKAVASIAVVALHHIQSGKNIPGLIPLRVVEVNDFWNYVLLSLSDSPVMICKQKG